MGDVGCPHSGAALPSQFSVATAPAEQPSIGALQVPLLICPGLGVRGLLPCCLWDPRACLALQQYWANTPTAVCQLLLAGAPPMTVQRCWRQSVPLSGAQGSLRAGPESFLHRQGAGSKPEPGAVFYKTQRTDSSEELPIHGARLKDRGQPTPSGHGSRPRSHRGPPAAFLQARLSGRSDSRCGLGVLGWRQVAGADRAEEGISSHHPVTAQGQRPGEPT